MQDFCVFNPLFKNIDFLKEEEYKPMIKSYFKQLWQLDNIVVLFGAGASKYLGGPLMINLSETILPYLILEGHKKYNGQTAMQIMWNNLWEVNETHFTENTINESGLQHIRTLNIETKLSELKMLLYSLSVMGLESAFIDSCIVTIKDQIIEKTSSFVPNTKSYPSDFARFTESVKPLRDMLKRLIKLRRPNQPRIKLFTTNYDLVIETACDMEGINCNTGFEGVNTRIFNPTNFDLNISLKPIAQNMVYYPNSIYLYKLHGSVNWAHVVMDGIQEIIQYECTNPDTATVIYPCSTKYSETLEMPFGEMFRRFGDCVSQSQTVIVTLGYGFMDEHVNQVLFRSLKNPSTQLVIIEPSIDFDVWSEHPSPYIKKFIQETGYSNEENKYETGEPRLCLVGGNKAKFPDVLEYILPQEEFDDPLEKVKGLIRDLTSLGGVE